MTGSYREGKRIIMKLRKMIVLLFVFLAVVPLTFLGVTNMAYYNRKLETVLENDLRVAVSTQVKAIDNFFEERQTDSAVILGYQVVHELMEGDLRGGAKATLQAEVNDLLQSRIGHNRFVESITLLDSDFVVTACNFPWAIGQTSNLREIDARYLSPEMRFTDVIDRADGSGRKVIAAIQQIFCGDKPCGYLVQELNLAFFEELRVSASLFNNGTIYLLDSKGQMIAAGDTVQPRNDFVLSEEEQGDFHRAWEDRDKSQSKGVLFYNARGERYMSCYSGFAHTDWQMLSSVNIDQVLRTREGYRDLFLLIAGALAVLLVALNVILSRNVIRPIDRMVKLFAQIRQNRDYTLRFDEMGCQEIQIVTRGINSLLTSIAQCMESEKEKQALLTEKARRDPLTGLYNKDILREYLQQALDAGKRVVFLFVDVDDFKSFNTRYGHMGGDRVLCFIGDALRDFAGEMAGRQGGDEFVAFLEDAPEEPAIAQSLSRLLSQLNRGIALEEGGSPVEIRCSIGAAVSSPGSDCETLVTLADQAMYEVKHHGKNQYAILADSHTAEAKIDGKLSEIAN